MAINVLVIGDVMLDQYMKGSVRRKSPEADIPVLDQVKTRIEVGGAANVALNAKLLDCNVHLIGVVGRDVKAKTLSSLLYQHNINASLIEDESRPTTVKTRIFNNSDQIVRVDEESTADIDAIIQEEVLTQLDNLLSIQKFHVAILQDYNKGVLCAKLIPQIISKLKTKGIFIAVDPKEKNIELYQGVNLFKPNLNELKKWGSIEKSKKFNKNWVERLAEELREKICAEKVLVTLSENGCFYTSKNTSAFKSAIPIEVADVCGAGDAVMVVAALATFENKTIDEILSISVKAGRIVCLKEGVSTISMEELNEK